jgi:hypothetical protein
MKRRYLWHAAQTLYVLVKACTAIYTNLNYANGSRLRNRIENRELCNAIQTYSPGSVGFCTNWSRAPSRSLWSVRTKNGNSTTSGPQGSEERKKAVQPCYPLLVCAKGIATACGYHLIRVSQNAVLIDRSSCITWKWRNRLSYVHGVHDQTENGGLGDAKYQRPFISCV